MKTKIVKPKLEKTPNEKKLKKQLNELRKEYKLLNEKWLIGTIKVNQLCDMLQGEIKVLESKNSELKDTIEYAKEININAQNEISRQENLLMKLDNEFEKVQAEKAKINKNMLLKFIYKLMIK